MRLECDDVIDSMGEGEGEREGHERNSRGCMHKYVQCQALLAVLYRHASTQIAFIAFVLLNEFLLDQENCGGVRFVVVHVLFFFKEGKVK